MSGDKPSARYDVISDRRRRWSAIEKAAIVAEASGDCPNISAVARRRGIKPSLLFRWKQEHDRAACTPRAPAFVPVGLPAPTTTPDRDASPPAVPKQIAVSDPRMEVALANGRCVRVRTDVDTVALVRIIAALEDLEVPVPSHTVYAFGQHPGAGRMRTVLGPISGARFNPAVSLVMAIRGDLSKSDFIPFVVAQIIGGCLGTLAAHAMFDLPLLQFSSTARTGPSQWFAEFVAAFGLLITILGCVRFKPDFVAIAVGLYITAAYWFTASTSFANPAVTISRALTDTFAGINPVHVVPFIIAQILGALAGWRLMAWLIASNAEHAIYAKARSS